MGFRRDRRDEKENSLHRTDSKDDAKPDQQTLANLEAWLKDLEVLIYRLQNEYNKYWAGAEKKPPVPLRTELEQLMQKIRGTKKAALSPSQALKVQNAQNTYSTYTRNWDQRTQEYQQRRR